jgi:hypothetical protein
MRIEKRVRAGKKELRIIKNKMRTRTKVCIVSSLWVGILVTIAIIVNCLSERSNTPAIILVLTGGDTLKWIAHIAGVVKENINTSNWEWSQCQCPNPYGSGGVNSEINNPVEGGGI